MCVCVWYEGRLGMNVGVIRWKCWEEWVIWVCVWKNLWMTWQESWEEYEWCEERKSDWHWVFGRDEGILGKGNLEKNVCTVWRKGKNLVVVSTPSQPWWLYWGNFEKMWMIISNEELGKRVQVIWWESYHKAATWTEMAVYLYMNILYSQH